MTTFETPNPITTNIDIRWGNITITAEDRADTAVEIRPSNNANPADVEAAQGATVDLIGDRLTVLGAQQPLLARLTNKGCIEVFITIPTGTPLRATLGQGDIRATGVLGGCSLKTGAGHILCDDTGTLHAVTGAGDVIIGRVTGDATIKTGSGATQVQSVTGNLELKNSGGTPRIGTVGGDLNVRTAAGDITAESVGGRVAARTASGSIRIERAAGSEADLKTAYGNIEFAVAPGLATWLDLDTGFGRIDNDLTQTDGPAASGPTQRVIARTSYGDIRIRRAGAQRDGSES